MTINRLHVCFAYKIADKYSPTWAFLPAFALFLFIFKSRIKKLIAVKCGGEKAPEGLRQRLLLQISRTTIIRGQLW